MEVILAGYSVEKDVLDMIKKDLSLVKKELGINDLVSKKMINDLVDRLLDIDFTPETISAAYARISRDPRPVNELRAAARKEVDEARRSNQNIVFGMGHHSVAEHVKLNFDILGLSRLAVETLEHHRLCAYTEKSQRYITLDGDFIVPEEYSDKEKGDFNKLVETQNRFYFEILPKLVKFQMETNPLLAKIAREKTNRRLSDKNNKEKNTLEGWAKEDARYALSLATQAQLAFSPNARNLELILRRFKYHQLAEVRELGEKLYQQAKTIIPSLIIMADAEEFAKTQKTTLDDVFFREGGKDIKDATEKLLKSHASKIPAREEVIFTDANDLDKKIISSLIARNSKLDYFMAERIYDILSENERTAYIKDCLKNLGKFDSLPREFEKGELSYHLIISSSCFAQLKRHRMATLLENSYDPDLGITVPPSIKEIGMEEALKGVTDASAELYEMIKRNHPDSFGNQNIADYCLTNAHRRSVEMKMNLRELYHFSRMREDGHAQWDIRNIAHQMCRQARETFPITTMFLGGKDKFDQVKEGAYQK
ncbi:MAG: FAD-dependent thymidylate synthase [Nanoarchaeota archaeon]|nr:FAD-dependent thymidylate synthase [Nanoarchaeota archaeon]MBU1632029.1 FAD-dependent thymidylate synthase [Nanoarchaeota archaeon]MBU1875963.1 FAD-dependent thymidylate synthase [Nanoarchaeota archaeon]